MPKGKGTYGSQKGRPSKSDKDKPMDFFAKGKKAKGKDKKKGGFVPFGKGKK